MTIIDEHVEMFEEVLAQDATDGQDTACGKLVNEYRLVAHCVRANCQLIEPRGRRLRRKPDSFDDRSALRNRVEFAKPKTDQTVRVCVPVSSRKLYGPAWLIDTATINR